MRATGPVTFWSEQLRVWWHTTREMSSTPESEEIYWYIYDLAWNSSPLDDLRLAEELAPFEE